MIKILIVEDDIDLLENVIEFLLINNFQIASARNGKEALKEISKQVPDIIICDIAMPVMNGYELYEQLQKKPDTSIIPFIFLTAKTEVSDIRKGMSLGVDDYISKPFQYDDLLDSIRTRLSKQHRMIEVINTQPLKENTALTESLTLREREMIKHFCEGNTCKEIAEKLFISFHTVDSHRKNIEKKLGLKSISAIIKFALENNLN